MKQKRYGDTNTALTLTDKAFKVYSDTDPLDIYEIETADGYRYNLSGAIEASALTEEDVNEMLEGFADEQ